MHANSKISFFEFSLVLATMLSTIFLRILSQKNCKFYNVFIFEATFSL